MTVRDLAIVATAYLLGCVQTGYYLVRLRTGQDLRRLGSGATGARNTGRVLGKPGFALALLGDVGKAALAVGISSRLAVSPWTIPGALVAVTAGHLWPVQLGFSGGRGVAVGLGALVVCAPQLLAVLVAATLVGYAVCRHFQASGLLGFAVLPLAAWYLRVGPELLLGLVGLSALVLFAHRNHIAHWLSRTPTPCEREKE